MDSRALAKLSTQLLQIGDESPNYKIEIQKPEDDEPYVFTGDDGGLITVSVESGEDNGASTATVVFHNIDEKLIQEITHYRKNITPTIKAGGLYIDPDFQKVLKGNTLQLNAILVTSNGNLNVTDSSRIVWSATPGISISRGLISNTNTQGEFIVTATYTDPSIIDANNENNHTWTATSTIVVCEKSYDVYDSIIKIKPYDEEDIDGDYVRITLNNQVIASDFMLKGPNEAPVLTLNLRPGLNILKVGSRGSGRQYLINKANANYTIDSDWAVYKNWIDRGAPEHEGEPQIPIEKLPRSADSGEPGITSNVVIYNSDDEIILASDTNKRFFLHADKDPYAQWYVDCEKFFLIWTFVNYDVPARPEIPSIPPEAIYLEHTPPFYKLFAPENKIRIYLGYEDVIPPVLTGAIDKVEVNSAEKTLTLTCRDNMRYLIDQSIDPLKFGLALTYPRRDIKIQAPTQAPTIKKVIVVNGMSVNIRVGPGINYNKIGKANTGDTFEYISESGNWFNIRYNGQSAYISKTYSYIRTIDTNPQTNTSIVRAKTNGGNLNVRSQPNLSAKIIGLMANGETAIYLDTSTDGKWYKIWRNNREGWVSSSWSVMEG